MHLDFHTVFPCACCVDRRLDHLANYNILLVTCIFGTIGFTTLSYRLSGAPSDTSVENMQITLEFLVPNIQIANISIVVTWTSPIMPFTSDPKPSHHHSALIAPSLLRSPPLRARAPHPPTPARPQYPPTGPPH